MKLSTVWVVALSLFGVVAGLACAHAPPVPGAPASAGNSASGLATAREPGVDGPPVARRVDVVETLGGEQIADPYRWMEGSENTELDSWLKAQGRYTTQQLERLGGRAALLARVRALGFGTSVILPPTRVGARLFYEQIPADAQVSRLEVRDADGQTRVLVDPNTMDGHGSHVTVDSYSPSPDGTLVAYNLSPGGSEITSIHLVRTDGSGALPEVVDHVWGEFYATWLPDASGFFYTQIIEPRPGVDPMFDMRVRLHRLGTPVADDPVVLGSSVGNAMGFEPQEFPFLEAPAGSAWLLAGGFGARPEQRLAIARASELDRSGKGQTRWKQVARYEDSVEGADIHGDRLYLLTRKGAPLGRIVSVPLEAPNLERARSEVAESPDASIQSFTVAQDGLYVLDLGAGHSRVRRLPWKSRVPSTVELPYPGSISHLAADANRDGVVVDLSGWTQPTELLAYDPVAGKLSPIGLRTTTPAEPERFVTDEVEVTSADGTQVPLSILHPKELSHDGARPTIVTGYGGYAVSLTPEFRPTLTAWLERGGVFAVCHVRGGGEKGESWHEAGMRNNKMNGVADLIACGEHLIAQRFTTSARMAAVGYSMGGVLIGRTLTERPDLFAAAHIGVGIVNPLRILMAENGKNQLAELGSPETVEGLRGLIDMDPYTHVAQGGAYPAVLFTVGMRDARVSPWMTAKMAARLQASTASGKPVLVRVDDDSGHGIGSTRDQALAERSDVFSFLLAAFGDPEFSANPH